MPLSVGQLISISVTNNKVKSESFIVSQVLLILMTETYPLAEVETAWEQELVFQMIDVAIIMFGSFAVCTHPRTCDNIFPADVVIAEVIIRED